MDKLLIKALSSLYWSPVWCNKWILRLRVCKWTGFVSLLEVEIIVPVRFIVKHAEQILGDFGGLYRGEFVLNWALAAQQPRWKGAWKVFKLVIESQCVLAHLICGLRPHGDAVPPEDRLFALDGVIAGDLWICLVSLSQSTLSVPFSEYGRMLVERVVLSWGVIIAEEWSCPTCQVHGQLLNWETNQSMSVLRIDKSVLNAIKCDTYYHSSQITDFIPETWAC